MNSKIAEFLLDVSHKYNVLALKDQNNKSKAKVADLYANASRVVEGIEKDVTKMSEGELQQYKGIGPSISKAILQGPKYANLKNVLKEKVTFYEVNRDLFDRIIERANKETGDYKRNVLFNMAYRILASKTPIKSGEDARKFPMVGDYSARVIDDLLKKEESFSFLSQEGREVLEDIGEEQALLSPDLSESDRTVIYWGDYIVTHRDETLIGDLSKIFNSEVNYEDGIYYVDIDNIDFYIVFVRGIVETEQGKAILFQPKRNGKLCLISY